MGHRPKWELVSLIGFQTGSSVLRPFNVFALIRDMHIQVGCVNKGEASLSQGKSICVHTGKHRPESGSSELAITYSLRLRNAQNVLKKNESAARCRARSPRCPAHARTSAGLIWAAPGSSLLMRELSCSSWKQSNV